MLQTGPKLLQEETSAMRGYIASMAAELADMARGAGDRRLALVLDLAATFAEIGASRESARDSKTESKESKESRLIGLAAASG